MAPAKASSIQLGKAGRKPFKSGLDIFIAGGEGAPGFSADQQGWLDAYKQALVEISPDFQTEHGYPVDKPGEADMSICTNYLTGAFNCLAMTLEMPFKDNADIPDADYGWSPARCRRLGEANLDAMLRVVEKLPIAG